jgi:8-oxo-dGTP pyrophosphatase MutT (NUDIX family)
MATKFILKEFSNDVEVSLPRNISEAQLMSFPAFQIWMTALKANLALQEKRDHAFYKFPYTLRTIEVQNVDWFGPKIGFLKMKAVIKSNNPDWNDLPGIAFLRGGSVAVLMILRPIDSMDERWVVMTEQPRIPAGSLEFREIPAGMLEKNKSLTGNAANEIKEETGFELPESELINLTELALLHSDSREKTLQNAMYPSPGGSDEYIPIFLWEKELDRQEIEDLKGKLTGQRKQGEMITLRVCDYDYLWKEGARDAKTLAAWALYEGLNRAGVIRKEIMKRRGITDT